MSKLSIPIALSVRNMLGTIDYLSLGNFQNLVMYVCNYLPSDPVTFLMRMLRTETYKIEFFRFVSYENERKCVL